VAIHEAESSLLWYYLFTPVVASFQLKMYFWQLFLSLIIITFFKRCYCCCHCIVLMMKGKYYILNHCCFCLVCCIHICSGRHRCEATMERSPAATHVVATAQAWAVWTARAVSAGAATVASPPHAAVRPGCGSRCGW